LAATDGSRTPDADTALAASLRRETTDQVRRGVLVAMGVRAIWAATLLVEALVVTIPIQHGQPAFYRVPPALLLFTIGLTAISLLLYVAAARSKRPMIWCFVTMIFDLVLTSELKFFWLLPLLQISAPYFVIVRYEDVLIMPIFVSIYALPLSRRLLMSTGLIAAAIWGLGVTWDFLKYPGAKLFLGPFGPGVTEARLRAMMDPVALVPDYLIVQVLLIALFALVLSLSTRAAERQVARAVAAAHASSQLARFLPPQLAALLAGREAARLAPVRRTVAVLFVASPPVGIGDRDGFSALERHYLRVERAVFEHGGVIDRFTGGPVMGAFGALSEDPQAASSALVCARRLLEDGAETHVSLHEGEAVCGLIGADQTRSFSVVGDTVHVARRMLDEAIARRARLLVSADAVRAAAPDARLAARLAEAGAFVPRGREAAVALWEAQA
jgi:class 3 adenylate cyclase